MKKLLYQNQSEMFEKIVCDRAGRVFRVRFVVVERGGALRGRIVSCEPVSTLSPFSKGGVPRALPCRQAGKRGGRGWFQVMFLPVETQNAETIRTVKKLGGKVASPYFNKFAFLAAIKIRAPSFT